MTNGSYIVPKKFDTEHPKLHLFGHDHNVFGTMTQNNIIFSNAALLDDQYYLYKEPKVIDF